MAKEENNKQISEKETVVKKLIQKKEIKKYIKWYCICPINI